jgi:hypothetical protein
VALARVQQPVQQLLEWSSGDLLAVIEREHEFEIGNPYSMGDFHGFGDDSEVISVVAVGCPLL